LCPENQGYCGLARRPDKADATLNGSIAAREDAAPYHCGINGGTIAVMESPRRSLDSACVERVKRKTRGSSCLRGGLGCKSSLFKNIIIKQCLVKKT
jgi:hypothetical protein